MVAESNVITPLLEKKGNFVVDDTVGIGLLFASLYRQKKADYAIVATNLYSAQRIYEFLLNFYDEKDLVFFPADELLRAESLSSSRELVAQRIYAMGQLREERPKILITHPAALLRYLPDPADFDARVLRIKKGDKLNLGQVRTQLIENGYSSVNKLDQSLQFAVRGDILDVFSVSSTKPVRIELFDDEVESIKYFDVATQSSENEIADTTILPATDMFLSDDQLSDFMLRAAQQIKIEKETLPVDVGRLLEQNSASDFENLISHNYKSELYKYYGYALKTPFNVLKYFDASIVFIASREQFISSVDQLLNEAHDYLSDLHIKARVITHLEEYMNLDEALPERHKIFYSYKYSTNPEDTFFNARPIVPAGTTIASIVPTVQSYLSTEKKVVLCLEQTHQADTVVSFLDNERIPYEKVDGFDLPKGQLGISNISLNEGFDLSTLGIAYLSSGELFGRKIANSRFTSRFKNSTILRSYDDLKPGDYVVHEYNGIGRFLDIQTLVIDGVHRDFLHIAYAGNEVLYVPLEQFRLVRKYSGREGAAPKLSHLSGEEWEKKKSKIKQRVNELADRLVSLYGARAKAKGFSFPPDEEFQHKFESEFPYQLTPDQQRSLDEIKADMEKPEIMDRLLCGDVGFGKTEVAFRCAFKAISAGKQVAILCPTTLLARQHYQVAMERFASFGINISVFSRLIPSATQNREIEDVANGKSQLIIGTHRLLSKEIKFQDLGLLIIDEEQRFGVEQKEKIKELKKSVDVLTLSATPIPRTLQMSLIGIRPLSQINTAPESRMPIQTYVIPYSDDVINELIQRELARNGQVFYLHNQVETIYGTADRLSRQIHGAQIGVVHGQMDKEQIEDVMEKFYDGQLNILVCTSIIENGIDIPNANMLIVENADRFGLSQLYQIKGRVGRGDRIAYAYLTYKQSKAMSEDAQKRLEAIQEFAELGSGYKIAQRDLMIRGAGDILGPEQAGFIDTVGFDLYIKLLNEAIEEKKTGVQAPEPKPEKLFSIDAYIPGKYADDSDKIQLYQELENIKSTKELQDFAKKLRDVYGRLPDETLLLLQKKRIDLLGSSEEFASIDESGDFVDLLMAPSFSRIDGIGVALFNALLPYIGSLKVTYIEKQLKLRLTKKDKWLGDLEEILKAVHKLYCERIS